MNQQRRYRRGEVDSVLAQFYETWAQLDAIVVRLREATERAEQVSTGLAPQLGKDPQSWPAMDRFLHLEQLLLELGRVVDEMKRDPTLLAGSRSRT